MRLLFYTLLLTVFYFLAACTSSPNLQSYPERQIDRPYTLPDDIATWTSAIGTNIVDDGRPSRTLSLSLLTFEQSITENLTLEYSPIPLGLRYQIANMKENIWGTSLRTTVGYTTVAGVIYEPTLGFYHRYRPGGSFAWESSVAYSHEFSDRSIEEESAILLTGPMFQLSDTMVLTPKIGFGVTRNELAKFEEYEELDFDVDEFLFSAPVSLSFRWLFHRQWQYGAYYRLNSLLLDDNRLAVHSFNLSLTHFW